MAETGSFDLFRRRDGWTPEAALVVSPYVEVEFFTRIARDLNPKRLHVVIDDGCRREDRQTVMDAVAAGGRKRSPFLKLKLGSARGLVHLKLFYICWRTPGGRAAHSLVFGSANATRQGFSGVDNAELVADCTLTATSHGDVIDWCGRVIHATCAAGEVTVPAMHGALLAKGMRLRLPAITVGREIAAVSDFDLWIQRGYLLSTYRPDPSFLRVLVPLAKALPSAEQARLAALAGFEFSQTKSVRHRYIDDGSREDDPGEESGAEAQNIGNWRRKLFTWTHLGEWCSETCFLAHKTEFKRRNHEKREAALSRLRDLRDAKARAAARELFLDKMSALWKVFGDQAPEFLFGRQEVDRNLYGKIFNERIERDLELIDDKEFESRYIAGFEFVQVPRFRNDVAGWRQFMDSLGRQLALDVTRGRSQSKLLGAIRDAAHKADEDGIMLQDPKSLIDFLREVWRSDSDPEGGPAAEIANYHER